MQCEVGCGGSTKSACIPLGCGSLLLSADGRGSLSSTFQRLVRETSYTSEEDGFPGRIVTGRIK